jgi:hypothetical protein
VVSFADDEGKNPHASRKSTESQIYILNQGYLPLGLQFTPRTVVINNSVAWAKKIVTSTSRSSV